MPSFWHWNCSRKIAFLQFPIPLYIEIFEKKKKKVFPIFSFSRITIEGKSFPIEKKEKSFSYFLFFPNNY